MYSHWIILLLFDVLRNISYLCTSDELDFNSCDMIYCIYLLLSVVCVGCVLLGFKHGGRYASLKNDAHSNLSSKELFLTWLFPAIFMTLGVLMMDISDYYGENSHLFFPEGKIFTFNRIVHYLWFPVPYGLFLVCDYLIAKRKIKQ